MSDDVETPPLTTLLNHWREMTAKGSTIGGWGLDRAEAILGHIDELETLVDHLRGTIEFNRAQAERIEVRHRSELNALRQLAATPEADR